MNKGDKVVIRDTLQEAVIQEVSKKDRNRIKVNNVWMDKKEVTWIPNKIQQAYLDMIPDEDMD